MPPEGAPHLITAARRRGILASYIDASGRRRRASLRTLRELFKAIDRPPPLRQADHPRLPPVVLVRLSARSVRIPGLARGRTAPRVELRRAGTRRWERALWRSRDQVHLPGDLGAGVHALRIRGQGDSWTIALVRAPPRLRRDPSSRTWGLFVPLHALRDARTWGCGDLRALERAGQWAAHYGASVLATLPLLPAYLSRPFDPSPYRPVSRRFWNEIFLDPRRTPEFRRSTALRRKVRSRGFLRRVARLERAEHVDFYEVARLKRSIVEQMVDEFAEAPTHRKKAFERFVRGSEGLEEYARFRATREGTGTKGRRYHAFVQWLVQEQLEGVARRLRRRGVRLGFDLPIGVHPRGFDVERDRSLYAQGVRVGSPPDPGVPAGQDWGCNPWIPGRLRDEGYRPFVEALRHQLSVAGVLRIDHVLGFHRLFWIPAGDPPRNGGYVRYPAEELYAILVAEATRANASVIGEDLGTVPREVRPALRAHGLLSVYVAELEWDGPPPHRPIPADSAASLNTHDHLPFGGYWTRRRATGPSCHGSSTGFPDVTRSTDRAFRLSVSRLARSPSRLLLVNLEDLWGETRPQNVPGSAGKNFSRRCARRVEEFTRDGRIAELLCTIAGLRAGRPR